MEAHPFCVSQMSLAGNRCSCSCSFGAEVVLVPEATFSCRLLRSSLASCCGGGGGGSGEPVGPPGVGCDPADCLIPSGSLCPGGFLTLEEAGLEPPLAPRFGRVFLSRLTFVSDFPRGSDGAPLCGTVALAEALARAAATKVEDGFTKWGLVRMWFWSSRSRALAVSSQWVRSSFTPLMVCSRILCKFENLEALILFAT